MEFPARRHCGAQGFDHLGVSEDTAVFHQGLAVDELFSCRNCIHNCGQSLLIGKGAGFCVKHDSVLLSPEEERPVSTFTERTFPVSLWTRD